MTAKATLTEREVAAEIGADSTEISAGGAVPAEEALPVGSG